MIDLNDIKFKLRERERQGLSLRATQSDEAVRRVIEPRLEVDYRQTFGVDVDRILHSHSYARYIDKTQVFFLVDHDHITHRVLHVQLVSKIARTIGRFLGLNEDLIEAIALGHDIGHTPFGHVGERFLSRLCQENGIGRFYHNLQSIQFLEKVERKGRGWNLCLQTLDGILCHDGEVHAQRLWPGDTKTFDELDAAVAAKKQQQKADLLPMTLEGCVMRMADTISYIGRDIEDAIRLGLIRRSDLPERCVRILGDSNGTIVYTLVSDIIRRSHGKDYIAFSPEIAEALKWLKRFNYQRIYRHPMLKRQKEKIGELFLYLFERFVGDLERDDHDSVIYSQYLDGMDGGYVEIHLPAEIVRDFIAGMTDSYFLRLCPERLRPNKLPTSNGV